jgi:GntR family transcriptional repressor for pyruvate dehydrogenase complex
MAVAYATKNPLQVYIMKNFYDLLFKGINENLFHLYEDPHNIELILEQHREILHAVREHNPDNAYRAMQRHINFVLDFFNFRQHK